MYIVLFQPFPESGISARDNRPIDFAHDRLSRNWDSVGVFFEKLAQNDIDAINEASCHFTGERKTLIEKGEVVLKALAFATDKDPDLALERLYQNNEEPKDVLRDLGLLDARTINLVISQL
ncbi:MAG: hypothetical protein NTY51_08705 [Deltaproteobacteria bacterium]|nr:hypothetical protein [Deltaproteobacteria bacterium]